MSFKKISGVLVCGCLISQTIAVAQVTPATKPDPAPSTDASTFRLNLPSLTLGLPTSLPSHNSSGLGYNSEFNFNSSSYQGSSLFGGPIASPRAQSPLLKDLNIRSLGLGFPAGNRDEFSNLTFNTDLSFNGMSLAIPGSVLSNYNSGLGLINSDFGISSKPNWWKDLPYYNPDGYVPKEIELCGPESGTLGYNQETPAEKLFWINCLERNERLNGLSEQDKLNLDIETCKCIRDSKIAEVQEAMVNRRLTGLNANNAGKNRIEESKAKASKMALDQTINGVMFQMISIVGQPNDFFNPATSKRIPNLLAAYSQNPYRSGSEKSDTTKNDQAPKNEQNTKNSQPSSNLVFGPEDVSKGIMGTNEPLPPGKCITPSEFMRTKQVPSPQSPELIEELSHSSFNPEAWDYKKLEKDYFALMDLSIEDRKGKLNEIRILKNKLKFLNYNPLIKYALSIDVPSLSNQDGTPTKYSEKKAQLFEQMRSLATKDCQSTYSQCRGKFNAFMADFLLDNQINKAIQQEETLDHYSRAKRKATRALFTPALTQDNIVAEFMENFKLGDPHDCRSDLATTSDAPDKCLNIYAPYCKLIDSYQSRIEANVPENKFLVDDLDEAYEDFVAGADGKEYEDFNKVMCESKASGGIFRGSKTFEEFVQRFCAGSKPPAACDRKSSAAYASLRAEFFKKFSLSEQQKQNLAFLGVSPDLFQGLTDGSSGRELGESVKTVLTQSFESPVPISLPSASSLEYEKSVSVSSKFENENLTEVISTPGSVASPASTSTSKDEKESKDEGFNFQQPVANSFTPFGGFSGAAVPGASGQPQNSAAKEVPNKENINELIEDATERLAQVAGKPEPQRSEADKQAISILQAQLAEMQASYARITQGMALSEEQNSALQKQLAQLRERQAESASRRPASIGGDDYAPVVAAKSVQDSIASAGGVASMNANRNPSGFGAASFGSSGFGAGNVMSPIKSSKLVNVSDMNGNLVLSRADAGPSTGKTGDEANGIAVPVSNKVYAEYLKNPDAFDFKKISGAIDPKQLDAMKESSEITLLLVNGNQTVEVKVRRNERGAFVPLSKPTMRKNLYSQFTAIFNDATKR